MDSARPWSGCRWVRPWGHWALPSLRSVSPAWHPPTRPFGWSGPQGQAGPPRWAALSAYPLLAPGPCGKGRLPRRTLWWAAPWAPPGLGELSLQQEQKRKTTLFVEKAEKARLRPPASGLPGGTEALCWENRKRGFPGPIGPPSGRPPQLPPILSSFCRPPAARLPVHLSVCPSDPGPERPASGQSRCPF